jgi:hypothetical protein
MCSLRSGQLSSGTAVVVALRTATPILRESS